MKIIGILYAENLHLDPGPAEWSVDTSLSHPARAYEAQSNRRKSVL